MALSSTDLAILSARFGVMRFGASRFGFCPDDVEGSGADEPGEYVWKEKKLTETTWTLQGQCEGNVCGWKPRASFTAAPSSGTAPLAVDFTDTSTPTNDIDSWAWDFGDGNTSTEQNPSHTFSTAAVYTVTLTVTNSKGSSTTTGTVTVTVVLGSISGTVTYIVEPAVSAPWPGVTVTLTVGGVETDTAVANGSGVYAFTDLEAGSYGVAVVEPQIPPGEASQQFGDGGVHAVDGDDITANIDCSVPG